MLCGQRLVYFAVRQNDKAAFADQIAKISKLTWAQIRLQDRHALGTEKHPPGKVKFKLPTHYTEDTNILCFRFSGRKPMAGYKDGAVFHILAFDRNYTLYNHG